MNNSKSPISEANLMAYIYEDVGDADIFGLPSANCFKHAESKNEEDEKQSLEVSDVLTETSLLKEQVQRLESEKALLEVRVSELYRTAKAEIERKDKRIVELTGKLDNMVFKRDRNISHTPYNVLRQNQGQEEFRNTDRNLSRPRVKSEDGYLENNTRQTDDQPKDIVKSEGRKECSNEEENKNKHSDLSSASRARSKNISDNASRIKVSPQRNSRLEPNSRSSHAKSSSNENKKELRAKEEDITCKDSYSDNSHPVDTESPIIIKTEQKLRIETANKNDGGHQVGQTRCSSSNNLSQQKQEVKPHLNPDYKIPRSRNNEAEESEPKSELQCNKLSGDTHTHKPNITNKEESVVKNGYTETMRKSRRNSEYLPRRPPRTPSGSPPRDSSERSPRRSQSGDRFDRFASQRQLSRSKVHNYKEDAWNEVRSKETTDGRKYRYERNSFDTRRIETSRSLERHERFLQSDNKGDFVGRSERSRSRFRHIDQRHFNTRYRFKSKERYMSNLHPRDRRRIDHKYSVSSRVKFGSRSSSSELTSKAGRRRENIETYRDWRNRNNECDQNEPRGFHPDEIQTKHNVLPSVEKDLQTLGHTQQTKRDLKSLRKEYETDFSDWDDFRLHLSPSSDDTIVYDHEDSQASFMYGKFGVNIELMDVEELERTVKRKQKELEGIEQTVSESKHLRDDDTDPSERSENNVAAKNKITPADGQSKSKKKRDKYLNTSPSRKEQSRKVRPNTNSSTRTEHTLRSEHVPDETLQNIEEINEYSEQLIARNPVDGDGELKKQISISKRVHFENGSSKHSNNKKTSNDISKNVNNEASEKLSKGNLTEPSRSGCELEPKNSYGSLIVKVQQIKEVQVNFTLNHKDKLKVNEHTNDKLEVNPAITASIEKDIVGVKAGDRESSECCPGSLNVEMDCSDDLSGKKEDKKKIDLNTYKKRNYLKSDVNQDVALDNMALSIDQPNNNAHESDKSDKMDKDYLNTSHGTGPMDTSKEQSNTLSDNSIKCSSSESKVSQPLTNENEHSDSKDVDKSQRSLDDVKLLENAENIPEEIIKDVNINSDNSSPVVEASNNYEVQSEVVINCIQEESKDMGSFIHDFSLSDDEERFSETKRLGDLAVIRHEGDHMKKINILDISIVRPGSVNTFKPSSLKMEPRNHLQAVGNDVPNFDRGNCAASDVQPECIESIQEAINDNCFDVEQTPYKKFNEGTKEGNSNKLDTEQLQRCLEDDAFSPNVKVKETETDSSSFENDSIFGIINMTNQSPKQVQQNDSQKKLDAKESNTPSPLLSRDKRVREQMLRLFGSESKSESEPVRKGADTVKKNLAKMTIINSPVDEKIPEIAQDAKSKKRSSKSKTADEILCNILRKQETSNQNLEHHRKVSKSVHFKDSCYPIFCNNPNYIPNPPDIDFRMKLAEHIEKQEEIELEVCKNLDISLETKERTQKLDQELVKLPATKRKRKSNAVENCIKIKMPFNSPTRKRKKLDNSNDDDQNKTKKPSRRSIVFDSDTSDDGENKEAVRRKASLGKKPKGSAKKGKDSLNNKQNKKIETNRSKSADESINLSHDGRIQANDVVENQCDDLHRIELEPTLQQKTECPSKNKTDSNQLNKSCTETKSITQKRTNNTKQRKQVIDQSNVQVNDKLLKRSTPRRITPVKIGEASFCRTSKTVPLVKANQSPLLHMEEMLKDYENKQSGNIQESLVDNSPSSQVICRTEVCSNISIKGVSHVYTNAPLLSGTNTTIQETTNYPEVNQINLDSKDISMLGTVERVIFDNMTDLLADKSLPTFESQNENIKSDKTASLETAITGLKECTSPLDFSNMLKKNVSTSTPFKAENTTKEHPTWTIQAQSGLCKNSPGSEVVDMSVSRKTYIISPLKRERRRRVKIVTGIV